MQNIHWPVYEERFAFWERVLFCYVDNFLYQEIEAICQCPLIKKMPKHIRRMILEDLFANANPVPDLTVRKDECISQEHYNHMHDKLEFFKLACSERLKALNFK